MSRPSVRVGFFGKLPSRGDFVRGSLSRAVVAPWDRWLQSVVPEAQARLGERWSDVWHAVPGWRFAFEPGVCGPQPMTGLWLPSADRVGRTFPLMIAAQVAGLDDAFLDAAECSGAAAIRDAATPDMLACRLSLAPHPAGPATPAAGDAATRWWRRAGKNGGEVLRGGALPDADTFVRMLTA